MTITDFYVAWHYLHNHEYFKHPEYGKSLSAFSPSLYIMVVRVNPEKDEIDDDNNQNTKTQVWLECGGWMIDPYTQTYTTCHDPELDTGGDTFEEAIINLANLVRNRYRYIF